MPEQELQFVANAITKAAERTGPDGRAYLVAPGVALVVGVVGNEFVPAEEIAKAAFGFNGRPLPLFHPMVGDQYISANSPELHNQLSVGHFWNAVFDGSKLRGEYWVDIAKATAMGGDALAILQALQANKQIETSTAYGRDFDPTPGEYQGKAYTGIARNLVPDHVAVLVNEQGKCSIRDGCGLLANSCTCSSEENMKDEEKDKAEALKVEPEKVVPPPVVNAASAVVTPDPLLAVNAELAATKTALGEFAKFFSDLGGVEKVRDIIQLANANSQAMAANAKREKDLLISALVGNSRCAFSKTDLEKLDIDYLGKLAASLQPVDYSGRALAINWQAPSSDDELVDLEELYKEAK